MSAARRIGRPVVRRRAVTNLPSLSAKDYGVNTFAAALKGIPYIGEALHQAIFGPGAERRMRRAEQMLTEIGERLQSAGATPTVNSEEFVRLLEDALPHIARATNEDVRARFRDLLLNAATLPPGSPEWQDAELAGKLLGEIDAPGLAVLAALGRCPEAANVDPSKDPIPKVSLISQPVPQLIVVDFDKNPGTRMTPLDYHWPAIEEWTQRLREKRLIHFQTVDARGGFDGICLSTLGQLLVRWALGDSRSPVAPSQQ
jgi:hypothetical protein